MDDKVFESARYLSDKYLKQYETKIDEMKLHKLLYFAQRESLIVSNTPLFNASFFAWRFGPVLPCIRAKYKNNAFPKVSSLSSDDIKLLDYTFDNYAYKPSWSLSRLTHGEFSWQNARKGVPEDENSNAKVLLSDILVDANRIRERRKLLDYANNR